MFMLDESVAAADPPEAFDTRFSVAERRNFGRQLLAVARGACNSGCALGFVVSCRVAVAGVGDVGELVPQESRWHFDHRRRFRHSRLVLGHSSKP